MTRSNQHIDGQAIADEILEEAERELQNLQKKVKLGIVLVGDNSVSKAYVEKKRKAGENIGVEVKSFEYPEDISTRKLRKEIVKICKRPNMEGVIVQLPLPSHINKQYILNAVSPEKDVDVLSERMSGKLYTGNANIYPATAGGVMKILDRYSIEIHGKSAVVVGFGQLVGKPVAHLLAQNNATVTILNEFTPDIAPYIKNADILISGAGQPRLIKKEMVKKEAIVIDAGTSKEKGKIVGDASPDVLENASYLTPVPGGVGPVTVAMLFRNLVTLAKK